jgi:hypothetical protein
MNAVPLTPAEIKARNERAREIVASHAASAKQKQIAQARLVKDGAVVNDRISSVNFSCNSVRI